MPTLLLRTEFFSYHLVFCFVLRQYIQKHLSFLYSRHLTLTQKSTLMILTKRRGGVNPNSCGSHRKNAYSCFSYFSSSAFFFQYHLFKTTRKGEGGGGSKTLHSHGVWELFHQQVEISKYEMIIAR